MRMSTNDRAAMAHTHYESLNIAQCTHNKMLADTVQMRFKATRTTIF